MDLKLNAASAKEANSGGKRITEPGAYVGVIKQAWFEQNDKGTKSIQFTFAADNGQEAGPLALYIINGDGKELPSMKTLNALLACLKLRDAQSKPGRVKLWDGQAQAEVEREKLVYPGLIGKRIGMLLQGEEQEYQGELKKRIQLLAPYCAETRRMAGEVLDQKTTAEALDRMLIWFESNKWRHAKGAKPAAAKRAEPVGAGADDFYDPEIPF